MLKIYLFFINTFYIFADYNNKSSLGNRGDDFFMKSILMIVQNFYPEIGSAANRFKNIYVLLKQNGYEVTVLTMNPSYPNQNLYEDGQFWDEEDIEQDVIRISSGKIKGYTSSVWFRLFHYLETMFLFILRFFG